jgi:hypothetical protein
MKILYSILLSLFVFILSAVYLPVLAQNAAVNLQGNFFADSPNAQAPFSSLGSAVSIILPNVIVFCGVLFFVLIIYGGFQLIVLGGQYMLSPQRVTQAKNMIYYGALGFLLVVTAYFILQIVGKVTGIDFINSNVI